MNNTPRHINSEQHSKKLKRQRKINRKYAKNKQKLNKEAEKLIS